LSVQAAASRETEVTFERGGLVAARSTAGRLGKTYILVAEVARWGARNGAPRVGIRADRGDRSPSGRRLATGIDRRQMQTGALLVALLLAAGIVSYGLARYLTAPTVKLRQATYELASGDLSARVGPKMGRRRDELADLGRDFDMMAERIQSLMESERRLLGDISHELRSPLARLQVALDLASQTADPETLGFLDRIERESGRLNGLIGHLLTLTRLENAGAEARREPVDLAQIVREVAADADFEARGNNRSVIVRNAEKCQVAGNAELLRSAIENVVRNGVRYTNESTAVEISLECRPDSIDRDASMVRDTNKRHAIIRVRDHGPGVPPEALEHLFRAFYRVADARDRQSGGVGLGLSITARAVHLHGGQVVAANAPDGGLVVELKIPIASDFQK
jgi:two-component system sensor histidine kinase CpxA